MKVIYAIRAVAIIFMAGSVGSVEIDRVDLWTGFCQSMLGISLYINSNYWEQTVSQLNRRQKYDRSRNSVQCLQR